MKVTNISDHIALDSRSAGLGEQFRELSPWLRQRLRRKLGDTPDVDDFVQESFVRFARYDSGSRNRHPRALLIRIAGNLLHDAHRRATARAVGRHVEFDQEKLAGELWSAADQDAFLAMKSAIMRLPEPLRAVFALARFTPMSHAEIAKALGVSVKTVEWRLARAITMCLEELRR